MLRITVAGASGFIGRDLIKRISQSHAVKALSRTPRSESSENLNWQTADLFSLNSTQEALKETDIAIYLVHSMMPASRLFQGSFYDTDLILADNFVQSCRKNGIKQIIYLGGVVPNGQLSRHLESRKEVEEVLKSSEIPVTILRAGLVVGNGGSSYEILKNLVLNLPLMILPRWTKNETPIIYLKDLSQIIKHSIGNKDFFDQTIDAVCGEPLKYCDLIQQTASHLNERTALIPVPINYTSFSKLWVSLFGRADYALTSPLIDSLLCDFSGLVPPKLIESLISHKTYQSMLPHIDLEKRTKRKKKRVFKNNNVRSIQRLAVKTDFTPEEVAYLYLEWLPGFMKPLVWVKKENEKNVSFRLRGIPWPLLTIKYIPTVFESNRVQFHVVGGLLSKTTDTGWLEFRSINKGQYLLGSINEFIPSLPWFIYKMTQAPVHKITMDRFGEFLDKKAKR